jgi:death-on-curing family protein
LSCKFHHCTLALVWRNTIAFLARVRKVTGLLLRAEVHPTDKRRKGPLLEDIRIAFRQEYQKWCDKIGEDRFHAEKRIGYQKILRAHYFLADYFSNEGEQVVFGIKSENMLLSAVGRQIVEFSGAVKWRNDLELCATLFYGLIKDHAFHDGNKRTALLTLFIHLLKVGRTLDVAHRDFEDLAVDTAASTLERHLHYEKFKKNNSKDDAAVLFIADFLRRKTRKVDKRQYLITFRQLDTILKKYGFYLDEPKNNHINILQEFQTKNLFGLRKKREIRVVAQVGCPSFKSEVSQSALKTIRNETKLTSQFGIDSQVFFKDADPIDALIGKFKGPLQRLKDK